MRTLLITSAIAALTAGSAFAGGLDRSGQMMGDLFAEGNVAKLSFGSVSPSVSGTGSIFGTNYASVANDYTSVAASLKFDVTDQFSIAIINDEPFGVDVEYPGSSASTELGGTKATVESRATTIVGRYKFNENLGVHAGVRMQSIEGNITLSGVAYGAANGYPLVASRGSEVGYLVGVSYEIPDIALRVALTYNSEIDYELDAVDSSGAHKLATTTPDSWNLEFQTGVAEDTLLFGSIRRASWGDFIVPARGLGGISLTDLDDSTNYNIGVARRFTDNFAGLVSVSFEAEGDDLVSPLAPTNGVLGLTIGGSYDINDQLTLRGGINYTKVGDARPQTSNTARASFTDNDSVGYGLSVSYKF